MKSTIDINRAEMKRLTAEKKRLSEVAEDAKKNYNAAMKQEIKIKAEKGKKNHEVYQLMQTILKRHHIDKPYYHGGKYNGKAMTNFMTNSQKIMADVQQAILNIPQDGRCPDGEVTEFCSLRVYDAIFSTARQPSGTIKDDELDQLDLFVLEGMKLWRALDCTTTAPKPHAIEDHLIDQIRQFEGIGEFTEDFVEQAHQDGIRDGRRIRTYKDKNDAATVLSNWEFKRKLPAIQMKISKVNEASKRMKTCTDHNTGDIIAVLRKMQGLWRFMQ
jgi:hypothetical protein